MKQCATCKHFFDDTQFYLAGKTKSGKERRANECIECRKQREMDRYIKLYDLIFSYREPCVVCGEPRKYLIDFHHRDPDAKEFTVSHWRQRSLNLLENELMKCDTLCKNCHAEYHYLHNHFDVTYDEYLTLMKDGSLDQLVRSPSS